VEKGEWRIERREECVGKAKRGKVRK